MSSSSTPDTGTPGGTPVPGTPGGTPAPAPVPGTPGGTPAPAPDPAPSIPWMPTKPTMGDIIRVGKDEHAAWTGGLPKSDWSGLDGTAHPGPVTPNQYRSSSISTSQKGHNFRKTGLTTKFTRAGDLETFQHQVWAHLEDTGMDSIAYVPDPVDPTLMVNVVDEHGRFTLESVQTLVKPQLSQYDSYDKTNDSESRDFLLNSLETDLAKELRAIVEPNEPFPTLWINLIRTRKPPRNSTSAVSSIPLFEPASSRTTNPRTTWPPITASQIARATFSTSGTGFGINPRSSPFLRSILTTKTRTFSAKPSPANYSKTTVFAFKAGKLAATISCSDQDVGITHPNAELDRQVRAYYLS